MNIIPVSAFSDNYIWHLVDETQSHAICVDPGDAAPVFEFLTHKNLTLKAIILTHHHFDHIGGTPKLLQAYPEIPIYGPADPRIPHVTHILHENDVLELNDYRFTILATPGHTASHICLFEPHKKWLFCGDTLFSAGCGRVFDGTIEDLHDSLQKLKALPDDTKVYCAHEYSLQNLSFAATVEPKNKSIHEHTQHLLHQQTHCSLPSNIALEKQTNPFLRTQELAVKEHAKEKGCKGDDSLSIFRQIRAEKDKF